MGWYVIYVQPGKEDNICTQIDGLFRHKKCTDYKLLVPKRKLKERHKGEIIEVIKKFFPGYILMRVNDPLDVFFEMRHLKNLYRFLNCDCEIQEIALEEISNIVCMVDDAGVIDVSEIYVEDNRIIVTKGPLMNYEGFVKKVDRRNHRAKMVFVFDGKSHYIDVSVNLIDGYKYISGKEIPFISN